MATATIATAAGMAVLLYFVFTRKLLLSEEARAAAEGGDGDNPSKAVKRRVSRRLAQAPATWREAVVTLAETLRFTYAETLGKWPIGDLAFGIRYLMRRQGNLQVASVYAGSNCVELKGDGIVDELIRLLRLLNLCMLFSKKPFPVFLESAGYSQEDVLLQEPKAGLLKPAFTIIRDKSSKCLLLLIRGTHSVKDTLTAVTGAVVPFHHSIVSDGGISELVLGYAHCGMVAAAHWIAKCTTPCLLKAVAEYSDYNIEIVGHSLGGGTAALLTYILRERKEFSPSTCVAFAPAACMTWDLAESGKHFITTVVNGSDLVPTFSTASIDNLRSEVTASSWLNDLREQVQNTKILNVVYRSAYALGSRLPSISNARARVAGAGAILRPVSSKTQVVMRSAQTVAQAVARNRPSFSSWSCMGARRRAIAAYTSPIGDDSPDPSCNASSKDSDSFMIESINSETLVDELESACSGESDHEEIEEEEHMGRETAKEEEMTEGELWFKLQKEHHTDGGINLQEAKLSLNEIAEEENVFLPEASKDKQPALSDGLEIQQFYPPGRIMHMVAIPSSETCPGEDGNTSEYFGIYETPRDLYNKIRLSSTMINDHYMPMYKQMMERLIDKLKEEDNDDDCIGTLL